VSLSFHDDPLFSASFHNSGSLIGEFCFPWPHIVSPVHIPTPKFLKPHACYKFTGNLPCILICIFIYPTELYFNLIQLLRTYLHDQSLRLTFSEATTRKMT